MIETIIDVRFYTVSNIRKIADHALIVELFLLY